MGGRGSGGGKGGGGGGAAKKIPTGEGITDKNELINLYNSAIQIYLLNSV